MMTEANPEEDAGVGYRRPPRHSPDSVLVGLATRAAAKRSLRNIATDVKATLAGPGLAEDQGERQDETGVVPSEGVLLRLREKALEWRRALPWISSSGSLRCSTATVPTRYWGAQDRLLRDREILDAYAEAIRSRPSSDVEVDPVSGEGGGEQRRCDKLLQAILREHLISFVRKVFATVSPGTRYLHNWHVDAIGAPADAGPCRPEPAAPNRSYAEKSVTT